MHSTYRKSVTSDGHRREQNIILVDEIAKTVELLLAVRDAVGLHLNVDKTVPPPQPLD